MTGIELIPSAKRLITSLRDMGYDFAQAVADVVDNSIEAEASLVTIDVEFDGDDSWVRITDNGTGMKPDELREALRFGAQREYSKDDLGKFGLGLKTASMSQCQRLAVASRWNPERADIAAYAWDLDHISRTNRWEILPVERNGLDPVIRHPLKENTGTVVLWQRLDRILGYKHPYGEMARKRLSQMCRDLEAHLGMVLEAFLSGEIRRKRFNVLVNGNEIKPWDPFCRSEAKTRQLQTVHIPIEYEGISGSVELEPFVLPHQDDFSSSDSFRRASGPANWNQQQGFYIYRAGRMIQSGGWSNLRAPDEHTKLARIAVRFSPSLDEAFKINVAKMRVQLPTQIRDAVRQAIIPVVRLAREVYDRRPPKAAAPSAPPKPSVASSATAETAAAENPGAAPASATTLNATNQQPNISPATPAETLMTFGQWSERLLRVATDGERPVIETVLKRVRQ